MFPFVEVANRVQHDIGNNLGDEPPAGRAEYGPDMLIGSEVRVGTPADLPPVVGREYHHRGPVFDGRDPPPVRGEPRVAVAHTVPVEAGDPPARRRVPQIVRAVRPP